MPILVPPTLKIYLHVRLERRSRKSIIYRAYLCEEPIHFGLNLLGSKHIVRSVMQKPMVFPRISNCGVYVRETAFERLPNFVNACL